MSDVQLKNIEMQIDDFSLGPVSFAIPNGSIAAIVGDNGSGKSTLLKIIMGLVNADKGTVQLYGEVSTRADDTWRKQVSYQPQTVSGCGDLTGKDLEVLVSRFSPEFNHEYFHQYVQSVDVALNKPFEKLSQGAQKKLTVALAFAQQKQVTVLDEPNAGADLMAQHHFMQEAIRYMEESDSRTLVFTSHHLEDIKKVADYLILLRKGQFLGMYNKDDLASRFIRFAVNSPLTEPFPGAVKIENGGFSFIACDEQLVADYLATKRIEVIGKTSVDLDDLLPWILSGEINIMRNEEGKYEAMESC